MMYFQLPRTLNMDMDENSLPWVCMRALRWVGADPEITPWASITYLNLMVSATGSLQLCPLMLWTICNCFITQAERADEADEHCNVFYNISIFLWLNTVAIYKFLFFFLISFWDSDFLLGLMKYYSIEFN